MRAILALLALPLFLLAAGCGENSPVDTENGNPGDEQMTDLNSEFGGYTATDESPAFGDDELAKLAEDGEPAEDPVADQPEYTELREHPTTDVYYLRLAWGMLEGDSANTVVTDWSGSLRLDRGAIVAERVLLFEGEDHIVRPRTERTLLEIVSQTKPHWDGVLVTILDPEDTLQSAENQLAIALGPFELTLAMSELASIDTIIDVDGIGNQVSITGALVVDPPCARGFLSGVWDRTDFEGGTFRGRWTTVRGWASGFVRGHWGVNDDGMNVFFGKYIGEDGEFRGFLRGRWGRADGRGAGWFRGYWYDADGEPFGTLHGAWKHEWRGHPAETDNRRPNGFFHGRWKEACFGIESEEPIEEP
jgi:hypothetical protein